RALVLDPDPQDGQWTAKALRAAGFQVEVEVSARDAVRSMQRLGAPDLVVCDLPQAAAFAAYLRGQPPLSQAAIVVHSWRADRALVARAIRAGVDAYVMKSGDAAPLMEAIRRVLGR